MNQWKWLTPAFVVAFSGMFGSASVAARAEESADLANPDESSLESEDVDEAGETLLSVDRNWWDFTDPERNWNWRFDFDRPHDRRSGSCVGYCGRLRGECEWVGHWRTGYSSRRFSACLKIYDMCMHNCTDRRWRWE